MTPDESCDLLKEWRDCGHRTRVVKSVNIGNRTQPPLKVRILEWRRDDESRARPPDGGCVWVASHRRALPRFADLRPGITWHSSVFASGMGLLICGLWVRFPPGSPRCLENPSSFASA